MMFRICFSALILLSLALSVTLLYLSSTFYVTDYGMFLSVLVVAALFYGLYMHSRWLSLAQEQQHKEESDEVLLNKGEVQLNKAR